MPDIEFKETSDPGGSLGQRKQTATGLIGTLAKHLGVEPVTRDDFVVPFDAATGVISGEEQPWSGGSTGAAGGGRNTVLYADSSMSRAEMERKFPVMRGRT
jgi:hypothetical protein